MTATPAEVNKETIRLLVDGINDHDLSIIDDLYAEDYTPKMGRAGSDEPVSGRAGVKALYEEWFAAFPDLRFHIDALIAEDDHVAAFSTLRGTHEKSFRGIESTGNVVEFQNVELFRLKDGEIVESDGMAAMVSLLEQLGVEIPLVG